MGRYRNLGIVLREGAPLTVRDYDADEDGNPARVVAEGRPLRLGAKGVADRVHDGRGSLEVSGRLRLGWRFSREDGSREGAFATKGSDLRECAQMKPEHLCDVR